MLLCDKEQRTERIYCVSERNIYVTEGACSYFLLVSVVCYTGLHLEECMENHSLKATVRRLIIQLADPGGLLCNHLIAAILVLMLIYLLTAVELTPGGSSTVHIYTQTIHTTTR